MVPGELIEAHGMDCYGGAHSRCMYIIINCILDCGFISGACRGAYHVPV